MAWAVANRVLRGRPFSYSALGRRPYIREYIFDRSPNKDTIKSRQMEVSETEENDNLFLCDAVPYAVVMHVFPTDKLANRFGRERLSLAIKDSPTLSQRVRDTRAAGGADNVTMKQIGNSFYTLVSSWCDFAGRSPSCDKITYDEYDAANPKSEQIFAESTSHSEIGHKHRISTPTFPNWGIHKRFLEGTQHTWLYRCPCGRDDQILWPDCILEVPKKKNPEELFARPGDRHYFGCPKCGKGIDRSIHLDETGGKFGGHWVALNKSAPPRRSSWKLTQLMAPWIHADTLVDKRANEVRYENQWRNEVLGEPYVSEDVTLTVEAVLACCRADFGWVDGSQGPWTHGEVAAGVDWGDVSWFVARCNYDTTGKSRLLYIEMIDSTNPLDHPKRVAELLRLLNVSLLVCDSGYGRDRNQLLFNWFPGKVFASFYAQAEGGSRIFRPAWQPAQRKVSLHRTATLKMVCHDFLMDQIDLPRNEGPRTDLLHTFARHHANLQLVKNYDPDKDTVEERMAASGPDHFAHANALAMVAEERITGITKRALLM